jgi:hypothetical protein
LIEVAWAGASDPLARDRMARWAAEVIWPGKGFDFGNCVCMGVLENGKAIACMVYHNYEPDAGIIEISGAATDKRWFQRHVLNEMFDYPFKRVGVQMLIMRVSAKSEQRHVHRMCKTYGFKTHLIPRLYGRHEDGIVFTLTDDDWRENKFNRLRKD